MSGERCKAEGKLFKANKKKRNDINGHIKQHFIINYDDGYFNCIYRNQSWS